MANVKEFAMSSMLQTFYVCDTKQCCKCLAFATRRKTHSFATNPWFCNEANALVGTLVG